ncbi:MAG: hypothetical protein ABSG68_03870 [Thermoguttaceae bacterium]
MRWTGRFSFLSLSLCAAVVLGLALAGCEPPKPPKQPSKLPATEPVAKPAEPSVVPETPTTPEERAGKTEEPKKPEEPAAKTEEPKKPEEPAAKTEEPKKPEEPAAKTEEPKKPEEPAAKTEEPKKPEEPAAKTEEPKKPEEPAAKEETKKEEPKKPEEPATKTEEPKKPEEPAAKTEEPKPEEPKAKEETKKEEPKKPEEAKPAEGAAEAPAAPKVSTFAPAEDLVAQAGKYQRDLEKAVAAEADYKDQPEGKILRDANTLVLVYLALGLDDQDNKYKANAGALVEAAQKLAAAKDYEAAKKAVDGLKAAAEASGKGDAELKWAKLASLEQLMKQVPLINTRLKKQVTRSPMKEAAGSAAVLAVIAQGAMANSSDTKKPGETKQWFQFCSDMRDAAAAVNSAASQDKKDDAAAAMDKLQQTCEDCHKVFKPE